MVQEAILKNELHKLIMGDGYEITNPLVEEPVDSGTLFGHLFNNYVRESGDKDFDEKLFLAMQKLLQTPEGLWWSLKLVHTYLFYFDHNVLLFTIDIRKLAPAINKSIHQQGPSLLNNRNYVGWRFEKGLCEPTSKYIERINRELMLQGSEKLVALHCG